MKRPVIKVARKGFDVRTAAPKDLTLDSTRNQFKVFMQGSTTISIPSGSNSYFRAGTVIKHGLDYQPQIFYWVQNPLTNKWAIGPAAWGHEDGRTGLTTDARGDGEYVIWAYNYDLPAPGTYGACTLNIEYIIFVEPQQNVWAEN